MFQQIAKMMEPGSAVVLSIAKEQDGRLCVSLRPCGKFDNAALAQGLTVTEDAAVLDEGFGDAVSTFAVAHSSLAEQVADRVAVVAAAAAAEKATAATAVKKAGGAKGAGAAKKQTVDGAKGDDEQAAIGGDGATGDGNARTAGGEVGGAEAELQLF